MRSMIDETGHKYGSLTVIRYEKDKNGRGAWLCQCDCGNTKIARGSDLRKGKITHCSTKCPCKKSNTFINEVGNRYGFLTVLYKTSFKSPSNKTLWHCKCDCGNECDVIGESLRTGHTKSCGCKSKELNSLKHSKDLTGLTFGYLTAIKKVGDSTSEGNIWQCKCSCGCEKDNILVPSSRLLSGNTSSCGNGKKSRGELEVEQYLKKHNIIFQTEYSFEDLYNPSTKRKLRFDFAILKNNKAIALIEYDGQQHFQPVEYFGGEEAFIRRTMNDNLKNIYCNNNNIPLIRIAYYDNIENKLNKILKEIY